MTQPETKNHLSLVTGALTLLLGGFFLVLWLLGGQEGAVWAASRMKTNSSVALVAVGACLLLRALRRGRSAGAIVALVPCLIGGSVLAQYLTGLDLGIDQLIAHEPPYPEDAVYAPNRVAPTAALSFLLLGLALLLIERPRGAFAAQWLAGAALAIGSFALVGYLYDAAVLYQPTVYIRISPATSTGVALASVGIFALRPEVGLARTFTSRGPGGFIARRLVVPLVAAPVILGWFARLLRSRELVGPSSGTAFLVVSTLVIFVVLVLLLARTLDRVEDARASVDERRRLQGLELKRAEDRLRAALEAAAIGTYSTDTKAQTFFTDAGLRRIFGLAPESAASVDDVAARIHPEDRQLWRASLERSHRDGVPFDMRYRIVLPGGEVRWIVDKGRLDRPGDEGVFSGACVDMTPEETARVAAEGANRAKDEFLAMLGHELRNPLSPILTALELMRLRGGDTFLRERAIIERQVGHVVRLVDDLLDVSRITRGIVSLQREALELATVVSGAIESVSPLLEQKRHTVVVDVPAEGCAVFGDRHRLEQVIANLVTNAAKYTDAGGRIEVTARREGGEAVLAVRDDGIGIADELQARIFELFVQGPRNFERSQGGLGIGLAIVRHLVQMHGGRVSVASRRPGRGTEFTVVLPLAAVDATAPTAPAPGPGSHARRPARVIVVDDNREAADLLGEGLTAAGHDVRVAYDGPRALTVAREHNPALAFVDLGLPVMDGFELGRRLREEHPPLGLVAVTGYGQERDREQTLAAGFEVHLVKPVALERAVAVADELLDREALAKAGAAGPSMASS